MKLRLISAGPLTLGVWLAVSAAGCPVDEAGIRISANGMSWLSTACRPCGPIPPPFPPPSRSDEDGGRPPPFGPGYDPGCACALPSRYPPNLGRNVTEARLFLITPADGKVQDASKCMTLHPCTDGGRSGSSSTCMVNDLNQQLDGAMPIGLGFDGLKRPDEAQLVLAFYQPQESTGEGSCHRADLIACTGLAAPLGGGDYDITCASCQGGSRTSTGPDNGPCPRDQSDRYSCFLQLCDSILAQNQFD